jgi:hypothetical protein
VPLQLVRPNITLAGTLYHSAAAQRIRAPPATATLQGGKGARLRHHANIMQLQGRRIDCCSAEICLHLGFIGSAPETEAPRHRVSGYFFRLRYRIYAHSAEYGLYSAATLRPY